MTALAVVAVVFLLALLLARWRGRKAVERMIRQ